MTHPLSDEAYTEDTYQERIRELEALLDECERAIDNLLHYGHPDWPVCQQALVTLSKLRGGEQ